MAQSDARRIIEEAKAAGLDIEDWPHDWSFKGVTLREDKRGGLHLSTETGWGGRIRDVQDLKEFDADPEQWLMRASRR